MERAEVVASVAGDLYTAEQSIDAAITQATTLVQSLIGSRAILNVSACAGAEAQAKVLEAIAALGVARQAMVASHEQMAKDHRRLGYGVYAAGWEDKYPEKPATTGEHRLRAV